MYYWDGQRWVSTLSPDGRHRWNGSAWEPLAVPAYVPAYQPARPPRQPTSWTRPLQLAVIAWYAQSAVYEVFLPFWMGGYMSQVVQQSVQRQQNAYPPGEGPPPGFTEMMSSLMTGSLWIGAFIGVTIAVVAIVAAWKRWVWAYYAILVLVGFGMLGFVYNLIDLATGGALTAAQAVRPPQWARVVAYISGVVDAALFVSMLVALVRRGPWGMRRVI